MEDFSLLQYRKRGGDGGSGALTVAGSGPQEVETDGEDGDDEGPFFDLELAAVSDEDDGDSGVDDGFDITGGGEEEESNGPTASPSLVLNGSSAKDQFPSSILKSATKFKVLVLRFKKSKSTAPNGPTSSAPKSQQQREESSREPGEAQSSDKLDEKEQSKFSTVKYLKMIKPLYVRTSKRYSDSLRFSGELRSGSPAEKEKRVSPGSIKIESEAAEDSAAAVAVAVAGDAKNPRNVPAGFRVVCKRLVKSRSASAADPPVAATIGSRIRDDSLTEQQDGIQSAILHCKRSFNSSTTDSENSHLSRFSSHPSDEQSMDSSRKSSEESARAHPD